MRHLTNGTMQQFLSMNAMLDPTKMFLIAAIQMKAIKTYRTRRNNEGKMSVVRSFHEYCP